MFTMPPCTTGVTVLASGLPDSLTTYSDEVFSKMQADTAKQKGAP